MRYTKKQIEEIDRCRNDIVYFANNYVKVIRPDTGISPVTLNDFQVEVIEKYETENTFFLPSKRQSGKTTVAAIILLHQSLFQVSKMSVVFANRKNDSDFVLDLIAEMYRRLPSFLTVSRLTSRTPRVLHFDNSCSVISAGSDPNCLRGLSSTTIYIDESDFVANLDAIVEMIHNCGFHVRSGSKLFATSTLSEKHNLSRYRRLGIEK